MPFAHASPQNAMGLQRSQGLLDFHTPNIASAQTLARSTLDIALAHFLTKRFIYYRHQLRSRCVVPAAMSYADCHDVCGLETLGAVPGHYDMTGDKCQTANCGSLYHKPAWAVLVLTISGTNNAEPALEDHASCPLMRLDTLPDEGLDFLFLLGPLNWFAWDPLHCSFCKGLQAKHNCQETEDERCFGKRIASVMLCGGE